MSASTRDATGGNDVLPAVVIGAGPAGLATSRELLRHGIEHLLLERGDRPGWSWANYYDSLTLHTGKHMSALPGLPLPRDAPVFVTREAFLHYLERYASRFALPLRTGWDVWRVERTGDAWQITGSQGRLRARVVVMASGIAANPRHPDIAGKARFRGAILHSVDYRRPADVQGPRVLVVGVGNSGAEIASELARAGCDVSISVRSGANVVPRAVLGIPVQYIAFQIRKLPAAMQRLTLRFMALAVRLRSGPPVLPRPRHGPLEAIPLIGFHLVDAIRAGRVKIRPGVAAFTAAGVRFADATEEPFDTVILATGFTAALASLGGTVRTDDRGFALRTDRVRSADVDDLWFVGHNYDASGGLYNIAHDAVIAAAAIARRLSRG